jgi:hypothetical protein
MGIAGIAGKGSVLGRNMLQTVEPAGKTVGERLTESLQALTAREPQVQQQSKQFGTP